MTDPTTPATRVTTPAIDMLFDGTDVDERLVAAGNRWKHTRTAMGVLALVNAAGLVVAFFGGHLIVAAVAAANAVGWAYCWLKSPTPVA